MKIKNNCVKDVYPVTTVDTTMFFIPNFLGTEKEQWFHIPRNRKLLRRISKVRPFPIIFKIKRP